MWTLRFGNHLHVYNKLRNEHKKALPIFNIPF